MHDLFAGSSGEFLPLDEYVADLEERRRGAGAGHASWKLERRQTFREPGEPSWMAFTRGKWDEALRLIEAEREGLEEYFGAGAEAGVTYHRVRVVEEPITSYLRWELHFLRVEVESGERVRVVGAEAVRPLEAAGLLPELLTIGPDTVYEIRYDQAGEIEGAVRFLDGRVRRRCVDLIHGLYSRGEDLEEYFQREISALAPPGAA